MIGYLDWRYPPVVFLDGYGRSGEFGGRFDRSNMAGSVCGGRGFRRWLVCHWDRSDLVEPLQMCLPFGLSFFPIGLLFQLTFFSIGFFLLSKIVPYVVL